MKLMVVTCALLLLSLSSIGNGPPRPVAVASLEEVYLKCTCPTETEPNPKKLYKKDAIYEFSWISDSDREKGGGWCYFRGFKNLHPQNTVVVDFPEADMNIKVVPPTGEVVNMASNQPGYEDPVKAFNLYYAPLNTTKVSAGLFRPQSQIAMIEPSDTVGGGLASATPQSRTDTSRPIVAQIRYDLRDPITAKDYKVLVELSSSVKREDKAYRYSFSMVNQGKDDLRFEWEAITKTYDPVFMAILKKAFLQGTRTDMPGIQLESGQKFEIRPLSGNSPEIIRGVINIYSNNTLLAKGFAPAFIPGSRW